MQQYYQQVITSISQQVLGKEHQIKLALTCLIADGHLLIEDLPGMGKTTLSYSLATAIGLSFNRVQFTSDLLPSDITGVNIFDNNKHDFVFHKGPIFSQLLLADEINRASPKTQSALLEAMEERQVSVDGLTRTLSEPFFVIATQNPLHQSGTYPLPESQLDRFLMRIRLGYPDWESEIKMLDDENDNSSTSLTNIISAQQFIETQHQAMSVNASRAIVEYILRLVTYSRESEHFPNPLSPRASKALLKSAKAWAYLHNREYVVPEDVQAVFPSIAEHRLRNSYNSGAGDYELSQQLLQDVDALAA